MTISQFSCQQFPNTSILTGASLIVYQGGTIDHGTHVPGPVYQSSAESDYNVAYTLGMSLSHFRMLINEFLTNDTDIVPQEAPLFLLDINSDVCMARKIKDTKHTKHISRRLHLVRNGQKLKMHKIDWYEGGLQLEDIATNNVGQNDLNPRIKYVMVRLDN